MEKEIEDRMKNLLLIIAFLFLLIICELDCQDNQFSEYEKFACSDSLAIKITQLFLNKTFLKDNLKSFQFNVCRTDKEVWVYLVRNNNSIPMIRIDCPNLRLNFFCIVYFDIWRFFILKNTFNDENEVKEYAGLIIADRLGIEAMTQYKKQTIDDKGDHYLVMYSIDDNTLGGDVSIEINKNNGMVKRFIEGK